MNYKIIPVTHYSQNCSVVWCEQTRKAALIDPGGEADKLLSVIASLGLILEKVLLTHGHMDHVGATAAVVAATGVPIEGPHVADAFWIDALEQQAKMMDFKPEPSFTPDRWLVDGDYVTVGHSKLQVFHCPGHTPGHVVFFSQAAQLAWVGDVLFKGSIGRTDFPRGNHQHLLDSILQKLWPLGDGVEFIPGHGPMSTLGWERLHNPFVADKRFG